jgi:hypothetical protein
MRLRILAIAALLAAPAGAGQVIGPSKCDAAKFKAAGAYAQGLAACRSKAAKQGVPVDAACETKALAKLQKAFSNAEEKDDCTVSDFDNAPLVATQTETYVDDLTEALSQPPICCNLAIGGADNRCGWTLGAAACTARGGAIGGEGTQCHGVGSCETPPVGSGPCCENDGACEAGSINPPTCTNAGGTYLDDALCLPSGECQGPP